MFCRAEERSTNLHPLPNLRTGEGVSFQSLPYTAEADRDSARSLSHRKTNKNLVSKPTNEMEKGE